MLVCKQLLEFKIDQSAVTTVHSAYWLSSRFLIRDASLKYGTASQSTLLHFVVLSHKAVPFGCNMDTVWVTYIKRPRNKSSTNTLHDVTI